MKLVFAFLLIGFVSFAIFSSGVADSEVNTTSSNVVDAVGVGSLKSNDTVNEKLSKVDNGNEKIADLGKNDSSKRVESKEAERDAGAGVRSSESGGKKNDGVENAGDDGSEKEGDEKGKTIGGNGVSLSTGRKESSRGDECDSSSYSCNIKKESLVACLRVPGNESPDLSLLIQNKGKGPVSVSISAPKYVQLEKKQVGLKGEENQKIKVSFRNRGNDNFIVLKTENGKCDLDFRDLIERSTDKGAEYVSQFKYFTFSSSGIIFLAALLLCVLVWTFMNYQKKRLSKTGAKYQRLDMELPISNGAKIESNANDGWDNSWDDNWGDDDDEEAPKTPAMPVTPSFSSKHIVPRRSNKEGWKD